MEEKKVGIIFNEIRERLISATNDDDRAAVLADYNWSMAEVQEAMCRTFIDDSTLLNLLDRLNKELSPTLERYISKDFRNFLKLPRSCYDRTLTRIYLNSVFRATDPKDSKVYECTYDDTPLLNINYTSTARDSIVYRDEDLGIVTTLLVDADFKISITDGMKLLPRLNIPVDSISTGRIISYLDSNISEMVREIICENIIKKGIGFYHFVLEYQRIEKLLMTMTEPLLDDMGMKIIDCRINHITIPENIIINLQKESYARNKEIEDAKTENEIQRLSIEVYGKKLAVAGASGTDGLTEREKDLAFRRYLEKENNLLAKRADLDVETLGDRSLDFVKIEPMCPVEPKKPKQHGRNAFIAFIIGGLMLPGGILAAVLLEQPLYYILAGIGALVIGLGVLLVINENKVHARYLLENREYERKLETYKADMEEYRIKLEEYRNR